MKSHPHLFLLSVLVAFTWGIFLTNSWSQEWVPADIGLSDGDEVGAVTSESLYAHEISGGGSGLGGSSDSFYFLRESIRGNIEVEARLIALGVGERAESGLMIRSSTQANAAFAYVGINKQRELRFRWRSSGYAAELSLGTVVSGAQPVWFRLVRSNHGFAGYYSVNGINWSLVGTAEVSMAPQVEAGIAVTSDDPDVAVTAEYDHTLVTGNIPQLVDVSRPSEILLWLRADWGLQFDETGRASKWDDCSGYANDAFALNANKPLITADAFGTKPSIYFDNAELPELSQRKYFTVGNNASLNLKQTTVYVVARWPSTPLGQAGLVSKGGLNYGYTLNFNTGVPRFVIAKNYVEPWGEALAIDQPYVMGGMFEKLQGSDIRFYVNGVSSPSPFKTRTADIPDSSTAPLFIGQYLTAHTLPNPTAEQVYPYTGEIAELLVFNGRLSETKRRELDSYFKRKYQIASMPMPKAEPPEISLTEGIYNQDQTVTINGPSGGQIYYRINNGAAQLYNGSIDLGDGTLSLTAWTVKDGHANSEEVSIPITIEHDSSYVAREGLLVWLRADKGVELEGSTAQLKEWRSQVNGYKAIAGNADKPSEAPAGRPEWVNPSSSGLSANNPAINFHEDWLKIASKTDSQFNLNKHTIVIISRIDGSISTTTTGSVSTLVARVSSTNGYQVGILAKDGPKFQLRSQLLPTSSVRLSPDTLISGDTWNAFKSSYDTANLGVSVNNSVNANLARTANVGNSGTDFFIGVRTVTSNTPVAPFKGDIAEILVYNRDLTSRETRELNAYLYKRYQISSALKPTAEFAIDPPGGIMSAPPRLKFPSADGATILYKVNNGPVEAYEGGEVDISNISPQLSGGLYRYTIEATAVKPGFHDSLTKTATYFLDSNTSDIPRDSLKLWLRSDVGVTTRTTLGNEVTYWNDQSGSGNHLQTKVDPEEPGANFYPERIRTELGNKGAVEFGRIGLTRMIARNLNNPSLNLGAFSDPKKTIFAVVQDSYSSDGAVILEQQTDNDANGFSLSIGSTNNIRSRLHNGVISKGFVQSFYNLITNNALVDPNTSQTSLKLSVNRTAAAPITITGGEDSTTARPFSLGADPDASTTYFRGKIAELLIFDTALSTQAITRVEAYLANRYQLALQGPGFGMLLPTLSQPQASPKTGVWASGTWITVTPPTEEPTATLSYRYGLDSAPGGAWTQFTDGFAIESSYSAVCHVEIQASKSGFVSSVLSFQIGIDPAINGMPRDGLVVWVAADKDLITTTDSANVTRVDTWKDLSGRGNDFKRESISSNATTYPEFKAESSIIKRSNNFPASTVNFQGNRFLKIANKPDINSSVMTIFAVCAPTNSNLDMDRGILFKHHPLAYNGQDGWALSYQGKWGKVGFGPLTTFVSPIYTVGSTKSFAGSVLITAKTGSGLQLFSNNSYNSSPASWTSGGGSVVGDYELLMGGSTTRFLGTTYGFVKKIDLSLSSDLSRLATGMFLTGSGVGTNSKIEQRQAATDFVPAAVLTSIEGSSSNSLSTIQARSYMNGEVAEVLIFSKALNSLEINAVQDYLAAKYQFAYNRSLAAPVISIGQVANSIGGVFSGGQTATITPPMGATLNYRLDGELFTASGPASIPLGAGESGESRRYVISAWSSRAGYANSSTAYANVIIEPAADLVPRGNLKLWLRGDSVAVDSTSKVERWHDLSGFGHHLTKSTIAAATLPTALTSSSGFNGKPVVNFNESNLTCLSGNYPGLDASNVSLFAVVRRAATGDNTDEIIAERYKGGTPARGYSLQLKNAMNPTYTFITRSAAYRAQYSAPAEEVPSAVFIGGFHGAKDVSFFHQGAIVASKSFTNGAEVGLISSQPFNVGGGRKSKYFDGEIAELWVYDKELTQFEINALSVYAYRRYGTDSNRQVASPVADFQGGTYSASLSVRLDCANPGATIHYELGEAGQPESAVPIPSETSSQFDQDALDKIFIGGSQRVLKAYARKEGWLDSDVSSWTYRIEPGKTIIRDGLVAWFKADRGVVIDENSRVTAWIDQSGLGNHSWTALPEAKPLLVESIPDLNNQPAIQFNTSATQLPYGLRIPNPIKLPDTVRTNFETMSVLAVVRRVGESNNLVVKKGGFELRLHGSDTASKAQVKINSGATNLPIRHNQFEVIAGTYDKMTRKISNGRTALGVGQTALINQDANPIYIGSNLTKSHASNLRGSIAELFVYNRGLSEAERQLMEAYLRENYGIYESLTISLAPPSFSPSQEPSLSLSQPSEVAGFAPTGASIYYTTDSSLAISPSIETWTKYTQPIQLNYSTTIWAFSHAERSGFSDSAVISRSYVLDPEKYPGPVDDEEDTTPPVVTLEKPTNSVLLTTP